jgi:phosphoglycerate kinase
MIKFLKDLTGEELKGKRVLMRLDLNVPVAEGKVVNAYRIDRILPTIKFLRKHQAKIMLFSHIEIKDMEHPSLMPVYEYFKGKMPEASMFFLKSCFGDNALNVLGRMEEGDIVLFENLRQYEEEKKNDEPFAKSLATLGDIYVNEAFAVSHRSHASVVGIPKFLPSYGGLLLEEEIRNLDVSDESERPFIFMLGGAKFETKLPLIKKFLDKADHVFVGGALVNDILKAKGLEVGKSLVSEKPLDVSDIINHPKLILPLDVICKNGGTIEGKKINEVGPEDTIMDIGPETMEFLEKYIRESRYIIWNGPLGFYEKGFKSATISLAQSIGTGNTHSVVGGGDTLAAIQELKLEDKFTFISTGGGAMLDYLLDGTLPGIEVLKRG